jgi:hypothetical protein
MLLLAATCVSAGAAVALAVYAVKTYRRQSAQTQLLQEQAECDIQQRRRAQASQVSVWVESRPFDGNPEDTRAAACIRNTSSQPVYDLVLGLGERGDQRWAVLMPEGTYVMPGLGTAFATGQRPVWAAFRDSVGIRWLITTGGQLTELADQPGTTGTGRNLSRSAGARARGRGGAVSAADG